MKPLLIQRIINLHPYIAIVRHNRIILNFYAKSLSPRTPSPLLHTHNTSSLIPIWTHPYLYSDFRPHHQQPRFKRTLIPFKPRIPPLISTLPLSQPVFDPHILIVSAYRVIESKFILGCPWQRDVIHDCRTQ
jgi:hypothetical protein